MYRDVSDHVDEHDKAAAAILMAEALLATCDDAVAVVASPTAQGPERWRAVMQLHDTFPDVWRTLDKARTLVVARGGNAVAYDELAPSATRVAVVDRVHGIDKTVDVDASHLDRVALADAHRGLQALKLGLPSADWTTIEARTRELASAPLAKHRRPRLIVGIGVGVIASLIVGASFLPNPVHHKAVPKAVALKEQLAAIKEARKAKIDELRPEVARACDPPKSRTFTQLLVMDGRGADALTFADDYAARCGEDPVVENWANAPLPKDLQNGVYVIDFPALEVGGGGEPAVTGGVAADLGQLVPASDSI